MDIPNMEDIARAAGIAVLPPGGAWVCIKGCPAWPRGQRLIAAHRDIGIRHLDIYWASKETVVPVPTVRRFRKRNLRLPQAMLYDMMEGASPDEAMERAKQELLDYLDGSPWGHPRWQASLITISHPCPEEVRFYNSEVVVFAPDLIRRLLAENCIETIIFGQTTIPILEEILQEVVDALQIDGLSHAEAYHQALTAGMIEPENAIVPTWFYRPTGEFQRMFVEEPNVT